MRRLSKAHGGNTGGNKGGNGKRVMLQLCGRHICSKVTCADNSSSYGFYIELDLTNKKAEG